MDILTHTLTGAAAGTVAASLSGGSGRRQAGIVLLSALGGALPDVDAISLWSRFDATLGQWLNLKHSGHTIYFSTFWYSHHGFMHSLAAALLFTLAGLAASYLQHWRTEACTGLVGSLQYNAWPAGGFAGGYILAILQDMPTPSGIWGGVRFWWPAETYSGGTGTIWWWNNYDLFLIVTAVVILNILLLLVLHQKPAKRIVPALVMLAGAGLFLYQIHGREIDFNYHEYRPNPVQLEQKSLKQQQELLAPHLYTSMRRFDEKLPIAF